MRLLLVWTFWNYIFIKRSQWTEQIYLNPAECLLLVFTKRPELGLLISSKTFSFLLNFPALKKIYFIHWHIAGISGFILCESLRLSLLWNNVRSTLREKDINRLCFWAKTYLKSRSVNLNLSPHLILLWYGGCMRSIRSLQKKKKKLFS